MKAIILQEPGKFEIVTKPAPASPGPGEVLLKIRNISICGTDLHAFEGKQPFFTYPRILGHEVAAQVVAVGEEVSGIQPGDSCTIEPYRNLVIDQAVLRGKTNCGSKLTVFGVHEDGAMQEYIIFPASHVHLTNDLPAEQVSLVEPFAIGSHAVERAELKPNDTVLVIGAGPIGLGIIALARLHGVKIVVLDMVASRLAFAGKKFPGVATILAGNEVIEQLEQVFNGDLPTVIFDATGNKSSMQESFNLIAAGGTIVFVGLFTGEIVFDDPNFHRKEITLKASRNARAADFRKVINLMKSGLLDTEGFITHRLQADDLVRDFEKLFVKEEQVIKAVVSF
ncbi:zinc-binding alcohol dehydrogenase family protein [Flavihumibacter solisilvae]|uniref:L-iditol 2-dehydrogenase n=1 Tax=Flavihumibacter solisilvae TaxID=1349421 RepID=A0A0C1L348_9BACT|nr:zinc-binding alcohol dehydrogenase family protein [Flavihumibacter solisilvae]KIC94011.1 L-iditol 2-dehydrogenase [Flavihumibacter solisilvae]